MPSRAATEHRQPVSRLLGGRCRERVRPDGSLFFDEDPARPGPGVTPDRDALARHAVR